MMQTGVPATVFIAMPVYQGENFVGETLRSISAQEYTDYRVLMSVDANDERSADICRKWASADTRFEVVVQPERLGWVGNINWLMERCDCPYWIYWQQDDLCATSYIRELIAEAERYPHAACIYSDLQWFGTQIHRVEFPSTRGFAVERVMEMMEKLNFLPFRGLIRREALKRAGPVRDTGHGNALEDFIWSLKLAREGELIRAPATLYFKRAHTGSTHIAWSKWPAGRRRAAWLDTSLGLLDAASTVVGPAEQDRMIKTVLARCALPRPGRYQLYEPAQAGMSELVRFAADFIERACREQLIDLTAEFEVESDLAALERSLGDRRVLTAGSLASVVERYRQGDLEALEAAGRLVIEVSLRRLAFVRLQREAARSGRLELRFAAGESGSAILGTGWSEPEDWGVWSDGSEARLELPVPHDDCNWRVQLDATPYYGGLAPGGTRRVVARHDGRVLACWTILDGTPRPELEFALAARTGGHPATTVTFELPDAVSPAAVEQSPDQRQLGIAINGLVLERTNAPHQNLPDAGTPG